MSLGDGVVGSGEMRQDVFTGRWVIYAPGRAERPRDTAGQVGDTAQLPEKDAQCPFCVGNERMVPPIIYERPGQHGQGWLTRVVPNKYPVLHPGPNGATVGREIYRVKSRCGRHEVVIETPTHNRDIPFMTLDEVEAIIDTYVRRYGALYRDDDTVKAVLIFRNHGVRAGTSLCHPHSQIIATAFVPNSVRNRDHVNMVYYQSHNGCLMCEVIEHECSEGIRVIAENALFTSFVPFAAGVPCEIFIAPRRHHADFSLMTQREQRYFAEALQDALGRLRGALGDCDYNYVIHSSHGDAGVAPYMHWYLQIRPRVTAPAGFELGSGMEINSSCPEDDAERLRQGLIRPSAGKIGLPV